ncbi:MAG UNVERIFIED_CONTAM: GNAT family N-acetyltransferase [Planctomycetaceae bacterium]
MKETEQTKVEYRRATESDAVRIAHLNQLLAEETEGRRLPEEVVLSGVRRGLQLDPEVRYFVAESSGTVVGQLMLTREWSDWRNGWMLWLQSVYVVAGCRRQGVFRRLLEFGLDHCRRSNQPVCIRLYVEEENDAATAVYRRLGFGSAGYRVMERRESIP